MVNFTPGSFCGVMAGVKAVQQVLPYIEETDGETTYFMYVDGKVCVQKEGRPQLVQMKAEIFKTVITSEGGKTTTMRYHALDLWENRESAKFVPLCVPLAADELRNSPRMF